MLGLGSIVMAFNGALRVPARILALIYTVEFTDRTRANVGAALISPASPEQEREFFRDLDVDVLVAVEKNPAPSQLKREEQKTYDLRPFNDPACGVWILIGQEVAALISRKHHEQIEASKEEN